MRVLSEFVHRCLAPFMAGATSTGGKLVSDAHLAALAIERGAQLCSFDGDFARFPGLVWVDSLA